MTKKPSRDGPHDDVPAGADFADEVSLVERLPEAVLVSILGRLDLESLCASAPASRAFRDASAVALAGITALDLTGFSPTYQMLNRVLVGNNRLQKLTLDCSLLDNSSIESFAKEHLYELTLLKCSSFSSGIFVAIGQRCPNLRSLRLEMAFPHWKTQRNMCNAGIIKIGQMLMDCLFLESFTLKYYLENSFFLDCNILLHLLPATMKTLVLQPIRRWQAATFPALPWCANLKSLSLVLDVITDQLVILIVDNLPNLSEICLEDNPLNEPEMPNDLTNTGCEHLGFCHNLTGLSLARGKQHASSSFKRVNDFGFLLLAERCSRLQSIRLCGFSRVTDAGYVTLLLSCKDLQKFQITNAALLTDLSFLDVDNASSSIVEIRLLSCSLLTSDTAIYLSACKNLEVLDMSFCKSIADSGLTSVSKLRNLNLLDLAGADITDTGLSALGRCSSPIASLCLRGCKRVTDYGVASLIITNKVLQKTLLTFDLGYLPRVSDRAVQAIAEHCMQISNLCLRNCFFITDASLLTLGSSGRVARNHTLKMLDLFNCIGLSVDFLKLFASPYFRGLRWLGVGKTKVFDRRGDIKKESEVLANRSGLSVCVDGCEMGCKNEWPHHSRA